MPPESDAEVSPESGAFPEPRSTRQRFAWLLVLLPLCFSFWCGWLGIDFGQHWDQGHRVDDIQKAYSEQTLLPAEYNYPSVTFWTTVLASLPEASKYVDLDAGTTQFEGKFQRYLNSNEFQVRCRFLFLLLSSLVVLWTFAASMVWRKRPGEALLAACLLGGSFEVIYHSRWVAPDALMMQFGALCLLACFCARFGKRSAAWLKLAAIAAGLVAGTKYTGGILLLPVLFVTWTDSKGWWPLLRALLLFGLTFLFTTPGALLEPGKFIDALIFEMSHYAEGHSGFTVGAGMDHFTRNMRYLLLYGPSQQPLISALVSVFGFLGLLGLWRDSKVLALALSVMVVGYLSYISSQSVMFVRNLLLLFPVLALLSARGFGLVLETLPKGKGRTVLVSLVALSVIYNFNFNFRAADTIRHPDLAQRLERYMADHPQQSIQISPKVQSLLKQAGLDVPPGAATKPDSDVQFLVFMPAEIRTVGYWPSNDPDQFEEIIGPLSANYDYYASWWAARIVVMNVQAAYELAKEHPHAGVDKIFADLVPVPPPGKSQARQSNAAGTAQPPGKQVQLQERSGAPVPIATPPSTTDVPKK